MPKPDKATAASLPTGIWKPCSETSHEHPKVRVACEVMAGPKRYWLECSACGTRTLIAPKKLDTRRGPKPKGMTRRDAEQEGFLCL